MVDNYQRNVTHKDYNNPEKLKKYYHGVEKKNYSSPPIYKDEQKDKSEYKIINDNILVVIFSRISEVMIFGGGLLLFLAVIMYYSVRDNNVSSNLWLIILFSVLTLFFIILRCLLKSIF